MGGIIKFKGLRIEGFGSVVKPQIINLDTKGVTLVKGVNGAGKTTMFSALFWALYGVNLKGVKQDKVMSWKRLRGADFKGTRVLVTAVIGDQEVIIARHIDFRGTTKGLKGESKLMIFLDGELYGEGLHKSDGQAFINSLIGIDSTMFINSVMFGQRMKRLIESDNKSKRDLFEAMFDLGFIEDAKTKAKEKRDELVSEIQKIERSLSAEQRTVQDCEDRIEDIKSIEERFETQKREKLSKADDEISTYEASIKEIESELKKLRKTSTETVTEKELDAAKAVVEKTKKELYEQSDKNEELRDTKRDYVREVEKSEGELIRLEKELKETPENCSKCGADLDKEKVAKIKKALTSKIEAEKQVLETAKQGLEESEKAFEKGREAIAKLTEANDLAHDALTKLERKLSERDRIAEGIVALEDRILRGKEYLEKAKERRKEIEAEKPIVGELGKVVAQKVKAEESIEKLEKELEAKEAKKEKYEWWMSKAFGSGGLKAFVFHAMLEQLNNHIVKYASRLGSYVKFSVDLSKASKPFTTTCFIQGDEVDYEELSGGERQRMDIAMAFAMHDLIKSQVQMNILAMDEIFEGLDAEGIETAFDLIRVKAGENTSVFVITHSQTIDSLNTKSMTAVKDPELKSTVYE